MTVAVVLGVNGQDGSYLAEHLVGSGCEVVGVGRQERSRYFEPSPTFRYRQIDLAAGSEQLTQALHEIKPDRIYHLAAVHGSSGFSYEPLQAALWRVNVESVHASLEYIRSASPSCRLLFASSLKVFGAKPPEVVNERQPRVSTCLYSISKIASEELISYYRKQHRVRASAIYYLNHESPRRPPQYFIPRIATALASAIRSNGVTEVRSLDFWCDWGSSREFMQFSERLLECDRNDDYIMGSGSTWYAQTLVEAIFGLAGLDWRNHILLPPGLPSAGESPFHADMSLMEAAIGQTPSQSAVDVVRWILAEMHGIQLPAQKAAQA